MSKECPSCHADCPDVYQCDDCGHMFCKWCGKVAFFRGGPVAAHGCPACEGSFFGGQEKVSRDDSEDSSKFDTDSDSGGESSSDYDNSSSYSSSEGSSDSSGSGSSGSDWGGGIVALAVIAICWFLASSKQAGYQEWTQARQTYQAAVDGEVVRKQAFFKESKEVHSPPIGTFVYCRPLNCSAYSIGKTNPEDQVIVWNAGIEQKDTWDSSQAGYLWFGYIAAIEKHGNRSKVIVAVLPEDQYPEIRLVLQQGVDGSSYSPLYPRTTLIFKDDETRDSFYNAATGALEAWRARFLPEYRPAAQTAPNAKPEVIEPTDPEAESRPQIDPTVNSGLPQNIAESEAERQGQQPQQDAEQGIRGPAIATFDCVRSDNPRVTTTLVVDFASSSVKSLNGFGGIGAGVGAQITDATISWQNQVIKNYGGGGVLDFAGSIDRATSNFTFKGSDDSTYIFECHPS